MAEDNLILTPKLKGEDGHKTFSIRIRNETAQRLDALAASTGRSRNELIGLLLDYALDRCQVSQSE